MLLCFRSDCRYSQLLSLLAKSVSHVRTVIFPTALCSANAYNFAFVYFLDVLSFGNQNVNLIVLSAQADIKTAYGRFSFSPFTLKAWFGDFFLSIMYGSFSVSSAFAIRSSFLFCSCKSETMMFCCCSSFLIL